MPWNALVVQRDVVGADNPVQLVTPDNAKALGATQVHAVLVQALPTNTGRVVFGDRSASLTASVVNGNVLAMLPPPTTNIYPSANAGVPLAPAAVDLSNIWWCVSQAGDGFIVSFLT